MIDKITKRTVKNSRLNLAKTVSQSNSRRSERLRNTKNNYQSVDENFVPKHTMKGSQTKEVLPSKSSSKCKFCKYCISQKQAGRMHRDLQLHVYYVHDKLKPFKCCECSFSTS